MLHTFSKIRNKVGSQKHRYDRRSAGAVSTDSYDGYAASVQSSESSEKFGFDSPWMVDKHEEMASYAEILFPVENIDGQLAYTERSRVSDADSVGNASDSKQVWSPTSTKQSWTSSSLPEEDINIGPNVLPDYEEAEEQFLEEYEEYFEYLHLDNIRKEQYSKLETQKIAYLDYANFALFSRFQVEEHMHALLKEGPCMGSVSLANASSSHLMAHVFDTQERLLRLFRTSKSDYSVIFTTGFTAGCRLFGDIYPFQRGSLLLACQDNQEALKHVISAAVQWGGKAIIAPVRQLDLCLHSTGLRRMLKKQGWHSSRTGLFAYPAQSSLSGVCHSLNWIAEAQQNGWEVLLDVSTYLPTGYLDLSIHHPEFVMGSFHHILGYPSGLGFLLVRREKYSIQRILNTLKLVSSLDDGMDFHIFGEDDSINLLSFAALSFGLEHIESVGLLPIQKRVQSLMAWLVQNLISLMHKTSKVKPLLQVYGPQTPGKRGNIVSFNVIDSTGNIFPSNLVQRLAERTNIMVGAGHFSNPGLANMLSPSTEKIQDATVFNIISKFSAVRVSLGPMSNFQDVFRLVQFLQRFRDEDYVSTEAMGFIEEAQ
eukprot:c22054_g1_i1 orf=421-2208(-)